MEGLRLTFIGGLSFAAGFSLGAYLFSKPRGHSIRHLATLANEIKEEFQRTFSKKLAHIRQERRKLDKKSEAYENYVFDMMEASHADITKAQDKVLKRHNYKRQEFERDISLHCTQPDLAVVLENFTKISAVTEPPQTISSTDLRRVLERYYSIVANSDPESRYLDLTVFADEIFEEFGYETEHIELAASRLRGELGELYKKVQDANQSMDEGEEYRVTL